MIDLVITDIVMPKMSGPVLVANLTSLRPHIKVLFVSGYSVLFVSGYSNETVQRKGVPNLTRDFLQKSFLLRSPAGKIREVFDRTAMAHAARAAGSG
jgi:two-component system cell cycle sensor histidine kinase/response regulator CckA